MNYCPYLLEDKLQKYEEDVARKTEKQSKRLSVQMKSQTFDAVKPLTILRFLNGFTLACHTNRMPDGADMWLFHLFMKKPASKDPNARTSLKPKKKRLKTTVTLATYCELGNYRLSTYTTESVISETDAEMNSPSSHRT